MPCILVKRMNESSEEEPPTKTQRRKARQKTRESMESGCQLSFFGFLCIVFAPLRLCGRLFSLPLDRRGRLAADVVDDAVDAGHLVDDPRRNLRQQLVRQPRPVGG